MDVIVILKEERQKLQTQLDRIDSAITALGGQRTYSRNGSSRPRTGGHISAAGRRRLSALMKKRWAERRKNKSGKIRQSA